jgi:hypothetical protein
LLSGTATGLLIATPCVAIVTFLVVRRHDEQSPSQHRTSRKVPKISKVIPIQELTSEGTEYARKCCNTWACKRPLTRRQ